MRKVLLALLVCIGMYALTGYAKLTHHDLKGLVVPDLESLWPGWVNIPYTISEQFSKAEIARIKDAMLIIKESTQLEGYDCIKYVPLRCQNVYVNVTMNDECDVFAGRDVKAKYSGIGQQIKIGDSCIETGDILFFLTKTLGFYEEHRRPDRDDYITVNYENIAPENQKYFDKYTDEDLVIYLDKPYDHESIMHFGSYEYSSNGQPTITLKKDSSVVIPNRAERTSLSNLDIETIRKVYKCPAPYTN